MEDMKWYRGGAGAVAGAMCALAARRAKANVIGVVGLALVIDAAFEPPIWLLMFILLPLVLILCLGTLRPIKGLIIGLQYRNKAEQGRIAK